VMHDVAQAHNLSKRLKLHHCFTIIYQIML
jgi:hypothetical protein